VKDIVLSFSYNALPYQADDCPTGDRGPQSGYNICNSTTEGPTSLCQTLFVNSLEDFCLWGPPTPNSMVGDTEGQSVAWCTKSGHGTRVIPAGAITGAQFIQTADYIEVTGYIQQNLIDMDPTDGGGEMDPHGADGRGNAIGGLMFSNAFAASAGNPSNYVQVREWHNFMGSGVFCIKACDPSVANSAQYCDNLFDRIGCQYNVPAAYVDNVFESCLGDLQDPPGTYTGSDGKLTTYTQPAESLGAISTMPYTARIPSSSSCSTFSSAALFSGQPTASVALTSGATASVTSIATVSVTNVATTHATASASSHATSASATQSANAAGSVVPLGMGGVWSVALGVVGAAVGAIVAL